VTSVWKIVSNFLDFSGRKKLQDTKQNPLNYLAYPANHQHEAGRKSLIFDLAYEKISNRFGLQKANKTSHQSSSSSIKPFSLQRICNLFQVVFDTPRGTST
jgi:hypothetical protein